MSNYFFKLKLITVKITSFWKFTFGNDREQLEDKCPYTSFITVRLASVGRGAGFLSPPVHKPTSNSIYMHQGYHVLL